MPSPCPSSERFRALLANQLAETELVSLAEHLEACAACRRLLEETAGGTDWLPSKQLPQHGAEARPSPRLQAVMDRLCSFANATGPSAASESDEAQLDFLSPSDQPGILGRFGPYEIIEEIARGGMGIVLKARDPALDRIVAIKVLAPTLATNQAARSRFLREARAAAAISHEHVVDIHAVDEANGLPYLVMRFISGKSLAERIRATGPLRLEEILRIGTQIAAGLAAAHAQGLIHRDIKPANVLLENGIERVKITDFGLARAVEDARITQSGLLAGTPEFMAPEQARGEPVDHRADLFSLGCVLYFMATGTSPFAGPTLLAVIRRVCDEEPRPLHEANPALPGWFGEIVGQLLAKNPAQRPQSAKEVAEVLEQRLAAVQAPGGRVVPGLEPAPSRATHRTSIPAPRQWTRRQRIVVVSTSTALLVVSALVLTYAMSRPPRATGHGAFQLLASSGKGSRAFASLAEAVRAARAGDTIEVSGNGPFEVEPVTLDEKPLTLRAAAGTRPVLVSQSGSGEMFTTQALLVLEGLEFRPNMGRPFLRRPPPGYTGAVVSSRGAPLFIANCRFQIPFRERFHTEHSVLLTNSPYTELRNCEIFAKGGNGVRWVWDQTSAGAPPADAGPRLEIENCVFLGKTVLSVVHRIPSRAAISLMHNTVAPTVVLDLSEASQPRPSIFAGTNVFDCRVFLHPAVRTGSSVMKDILHWNEGHNLFAAVDSFCDPESDTEALRLKDLPAWNRYWVLTNTGSAQFRLGLGAALKGIDVDSLNARHFRLAPPEHNRIAAAGGDPSVAYGADIEKVGPGQAYDTWRRSASYPQWLERIRKFKR